MTWSTLRCACFLACSWTWCIGMFMPVLLIRDFGLWSFAVFALPNVIGAAAMGWVIRSGESSKALVAANEGACRAFSAVTAAFQAFFAVWIGQAVLTPEWWWLPVAAMLVVMAAAAAPYRSARRVTLVAALVLLASLACAQTYILRGQAQTSVALARASAPWLTEGELWPLAAVCLLGFGLCPYLDVSFHHARQQLGRGASRLAFSVGFGLFFLAMIAFTAMYAGDFLGWLQRQVVQQDPFRENVRPAGAVIVGVHIFAQLGFTYMLHRDPPRLRPPNPDDIPHGSRPRFEWAIAGIGAGLLAGPLAPVLGLAPYQGLHPAEIVYRGFMAFYGLVFPAYVWLCMLPTRHGHSGPRPDKVRVLLVAVLAAAPFYWLGFVERHTWWLGAGVAIVFLGRLLIRDGLGFAPVPAASAPRPPALSAAAAAGT